MLCRAGSWEILPHAVERMIERGVTVDDVRAVLTALGHAELREIVGACQEGTSSMSRSI